MMKRSPIIYEQQTLRLNRNECICPSFIADLIQSVNIDRKDFFTYTIPYDVINNLAKYLNCTSDNIHVNNGSEAVLKTLIEALDCNSWVTTSPTFELFNFYCNLYNKELIEIPFKYDSRFTVDVNITCTTPDTGLYIVSPHNPTGYVFETEEIYNLCTRYKYVIVDEAYLSPLSTLNIQSLPLNLIVVRTFSKMGMMTGMRFGFCLCSCVDLIDKLNQYRPMYINSITLKFIDYIINNAHILNDLELQFNNVKSLLNLNIVASAGNFVLLDNTPTYKGYKLKEYIFNDKKYHRLTLFDLETYNTL